MKQSSEYYLSYWCIQIDVLHVKKNKTRMLKSPSIIEEMHLDDIKAFASNIIDRYKNLPDNLQSLLLSRLCIQAYQRKDR